MSESTSGLVGYEGKGARAGFLEESEGVRSMTRLAAMLLTGGVVVLVLSLALYLHRGVPDPGVIAAMGVVITGLAAGVWAALRERA